MPKLVTMGPLTRPRMVLEGLWAVGLGVVASLLAWRIEVATGTPGFLGGVVSASQRIVPWLTLLGTFLSTLGIVYIVQTLRRMEQSRRERVNPGLIEIDLASSNAIVAQLNMATPQLWVRLYVTNHSGFNIRISHLTAKVHFGQTLIMLMKETHVDVPAHKTNRDVQFMTTIDNQKDQLTAFFADTANLTRAVYIDIVAACQVGADAFTLSPHFERYLPEINSVPR